MTLPATGVMSLQQIATEAGLPANQPRNFRERRMLHILTNITGGTIPFSLSGAYGKTWFGFNSGKHPTVEHYGFIRGAYGSSIKGNSETFKTPSMSISSFVNQRPDAVETRNRITIVISSTGGVGSIPSNLFSKVHIGFGITLTASTATITEDSTDGGGSQKAWTFFTGTLLGSAQVYDVVFE